jgi:hypothetical protein
LAALFFTPLPARSSLCALEALRWGVGGESMTTLGGTRTPCQSVPATPPCSAHRLLSWGRSSLVYLAPAPLLAPIHRSAWKKNSQKFTSGMVNKSGENRSARTLFPFPASNQPQHLAALDKDAGSRITCPLPNLAVDQGFTCFLL